MVAGQQLTAKRVGMDVHIDGGARTDGARGRRSQLVAEPEAAPRGIAGVLADQERGEGNALLSSREQRKSLALAFDVEGHPDLVEAALDADVLHVVERVAACRRAEVKSSAHQTPIMSLKAPRSIP